MASFNRPPSISRAIGIRRRRDAPAPRIWGLTLLLAGAASALLVVLARHAEPAVAVRLPWWGLAVAFALTEAFAVHIHFRRGAQTFTLGELPLVLGLIFATPLETVAAWVVGGGLVMILATRLPSVRVAFNVAHFALVGGIASLVFHAIGGSGASMGLTWLAATLAVLAASSTSVTLIFAAMTLTGERIGIRKLLELLAMAWFVAVTNASLGVAVATVLRADMWAGLLLLPAAGALFIAYRAYTEERAKHTSLEFLFAASRTLTKASDSTLGLAGLLAMAVETFRSASAEACLFPTGEQDAGSRVAVHGAGAVETTQSVDSAVVAELRELLGHEGSRIVAPDQVGEALGGHLRRHGIARAMITALPGDRGLLGAMMVADRLGVGDFGRTDLRLLETLGRHAASSLGQDRLERHVDELRELSRELEHQAFHDPLTGLANRLLFMDRVRNALSRREGSVAVIYIDLDDFKWVNDNLGHDAGDELLVGVADRIRSSLREEDTPARLGGDEFAILLLDIEEVNARTVADRVLQSLARPVTVAGDLRAVHASLGVALAPSRSTSAEDILRDADTAMYVSKHGGKSGYTFFDRQAAPAPV